MYLSDLIPQTSIYFLNIAAVTFEVVRKLSANGQQQSPIKHHALYCLSYENSFVPMVLVSVQVACLNGLSGFNFRSISSRLRRDY